MFAAPERRWAIVLTTGAVALLLLHAQVVPGLSGSTQTLVTAWLPLSTLNEGLVWSICALGVHVVVTRTSRVDLGFLAFWALGGYVAGWLMSAFVQQVDIRVLTAAFTWQRGIHLSFWLVLFVGGGICAGLAFMLWRIARPGGGMIETVAVEVFAILTWGVGVGLPQVIVNLGDVGGVDLSNGSRGIAPIDPIGLAGRRLGPFDLTWRFLVYAVLVALAIVLVRRVRRGSERAAYLTAAFLGGVGGVSYATHSFGVLPLRFDFLISVMLVTMAVIGVHEWGVVVASVVLTWVTTIGLPRLGDAISEGSGWSLDLWSAQMFLFGGLLVARVLWRANP